MHLNSTSSRDAVGFENLHPFDPITPQEIRSAVTILRKKFPDVKLRFKVVDLQEPRKKETVSFLESCRLGKRWPTKKPARLIQVLFHRLDTGVFMKSIINAAKTEVVSLVEFPKHVQGPLDVDELTEMEDICVNHPAVKAEIEKLQLPKGHRVCCDPWIYGTDDPKEDRRLVQCYMYILEVDHPETNHYSLPCSFAPVFDILTKELVRIDYLPTGINSTTKPTAPWKPTKAIEYCHELLDEPLRTDLKPLIVQQPEGPSFKCEGNLVKWQKWNFRVGFNNREGMTLHDVTYDGRSVFYRLSLSEMTVPYGDPRKPYHRKQAFDVGDVGLGITANQLALGCDCLGYIKYFDGYRVNSRGQPVLLKNVICMHEQDAGLQHKHTNYRTSAATVVRNRQLVVQMICTVSNYEYIFAWVFDQAAGIEFEVRATGILSTSPIENTNGEVVRWGTNIGPGVMAAYHQHIFCLRIDPAIDGQRNTVTYEESVPLPQDPDLNPFGVGYGTEEQILKTAGSVDTNVNKHRVFKIRNDSITNKISGKPVAYKLQAVPSQMMLMDPRSFNSIRATFATKPIWVTKYNDDELFAAGEFTNQSRKGTGLEDWALRGDNVQNEDIVVWHSFGLTHNPRPEDFPVMPVEKLVVGLRPSGFFEKNPALDVPPSSQSFNKSTLDETRPLCHKL